ncbi:G-type lectin S-receptor-like serine/threonine-protein kinase CES101 [Miscanthus floridulus]|uniref:G-type lectin S-receptor-like serine/threonine-protein kinase CES101 n=1 Tax=Miscanthus floridulus TaxID=154761 RepID=UPI00345760B1
MHTFAALQMDHGANSVAIAIVITSACCMEGILDCDLYSNFDKELIMDDHDGMKGAVVLIASPETRNFRSEHAPLHSVIVAAAANGDTLAAGQTLAAGDKLVSRNSKFALGFFQFQPPVPSSSISKSTDVTTSSSPVWEKPITDPELKLTQLKISQDGSLAIASYTMPLLNPLSGPTTHFFINRSTETSTNTTSAVLRNNGNLALIAHNNPSSDSNEVQPLWRSFDHPTDVGIPGAKLGWNKVTGFKWQYISKKNLIDPGLGSYSLEIGSNGILRLGRRNPPLVATWSWPSGKLATLLPVLSGLLESDPWTKGLF